MRTHEAAKYCDLSVSYFRKLMMARTFTMFKPSGKICYFRKEDLDEWMMSKRVGPSREEDKSGNGPEERGQ